MISAFGKSKTMAFDDIGAELRACLFNVRETRPDSHIYLLLDNGCPVSGDHPLHSAQLATRDVKRECVGVRQARAPSAEEWQPLLVRLFCAGEHGYQDENLIDLSVESAIDRCASINGSYVAAWIATDLAPRALADRLARCNEFFDSHHGRQQTLPMHQPHRIGLLCEDADAKAFLSVYLSAIHLWAFVDAAGSLRTISSTDSPAAREPTTKHLPLSHCRVQARVPMARRVLLGLRKAELDVPPRAEGVIDALLVHAGRQGLTHAEDIVFFALNSLTLSPNWHAHPQAQKFIGMSRDDAAPLAGLFSELPDETLEAIARHGYPPEPRA